MEHARLQEALARVVDRSEDAVAREGEDHGIRVQGAQPTEGGPLKSEVEHRMNELQGDDHAHEHSHHSPEQGGG